MSVFIMCSNWFLTSNYDFFPRRKSCIRRNHQVKEDTLLFFQGLSLLLVFTSLFSTPEFTDFLPRSLGMTLAMVDVFRVLVFYCHAPTHCTFLGLSAPITLLTSDEMSYLFLFLMAGRAVLVYQDE